MLVLSCVKLLMTSIFSVGADQYEVALVVKLWVLGVAAGVINMVYGERLV